MNCLDESNPDTKPPEPDNLDRLERQPVEGVTFLCYLSYQDRVAMRTTGDVEDDSNPPYALAEPPPPLLLPPGFTWDIPDPGDPASCAPDGEEDGDTFEWCDACAPERCSCGP